MGIYLVVSELLTEITPVLDDGNGPLEPYRIVELVAAKSREQARYLAWQTDIKHYESDDLSAMPNFRTRKLSNLDCGPDIISDCEFYHDYWNHHKSIELLNQEF